MIASVGRNAERQDAEERLGPEDERAVGKAETPITHCNNSTNPHPREAR